MWSHAAVTDQAASNATRSLEAPAVLQPEEALARCEYLVQNRRALGIVAGPPGCGKSTLLRHLQTVGRHWTRTRPVLLEMSGLDGIQWLRSLADELGLASHQRDLCDLLREIRNRVEGSAECGAQHLLLLDHFDLARGDVVTVLRGLIHSSAASRSLTVLATARSPLGTELRDLQREFGTVRIEIGPLSAPECEQFAESLLAGALDPEALRAVRQLTAGEPRQLDRLCEVLRLAGLAEGSRAITAEMVYSAYGELPDAPSGTLLSAQA